MPHPTSVEQTLPKLLTTKEAAEIASVSVKFLEKLRYERTGPKYLKLGRCVRYSTSDLADWISSQSTYQ
tara:strand:- start:137 stop:343 length:207 start_codon:yes stop_codon:yes gene_type:complete